MFKIIKKEDINIEELKQLKDDGIRPILLGEFTDEEKQLYYAMGIYDIASMNEEAEWMAKEETAYSSVEVKDLNKTQEVIVNKDVKVAKPGLFKRPIKMVIAGVSVLAIVGCGGLIAFGFSNNIVETPDVIATSEQKKEEINISDSKSTSLATNKKWVVENVSTVKQNKETLVSEKTGEPLDTEKYQKPVKADAPEVEIVYADSIEEAIEISNNNDDVIVAVENPNKKPLEPIVEETPEPIIEETPKSEPETPTVETPFNPVPPVEDNKAESNETESTTPDTTPSNEDEVEIPDEITFGEGILSGAVAEDDDIIPPVMEITNPEIDLGAGK